MTTSAASSFRNSRRSSPAKRFASLRVAQIGSYFWPAPFVNLAPQIADFEDTLAILQNVEHLVSVDTAVAHLAGACGVACSLILPYAPDWRWSDTNWYQC